MLTSFHLVSRQDLNLRAGKFNLLDYAQFDEEVAAADNRARFWVFVNHDQQTITLSCRGTVPRWETISDIWTDLHGEFHPAVESMNRQVFEGMKSTAKVHHGFWERFLEYRDQVKDFMDKANEIYPDYTRVITGHSLGGATAYMMAGYFAEIDMPFDAVYLYGAPKTGNSDFVDHLAQIIGPEKIVRVVNNIDVVPHLGPISLHGEHKSVHPKDPRAPEYYIGPEDVIPRKCKAWPDLNCSPGNSVLQYLRIKESWRQHRKLRDWQFHGICQVDHFDPQDLTA